MTDAMTPAEQDLLNAGMPWTLTLVWGILAVIFGLLLIATPVETLFTLILFMGVYWFVGGIFTLVSLMSDRIGMGWRICMGVISILAGLVIMIYPLYSSFLVVEMLVLFIGIWALVIGGVKLFEAVKHKDAGTGVLGVLSILFGLLLLGAPMAAALSLSLVVGFFALIGGFTAIFLAFQLRSAGSAT